MSPFHSRSKRNDPHLEWKVRLFAVAAVVGLLGIYFDEPWMGGVAIALLATGLALGVYGRRFEDAAWSDDEEDDDQKVADQKVADQADVEDGMNGEIEDHAGADDEAEREDIAGDPR